MNTLVTTLLTRELRASSSDILGRVSYGDEHTGVMRNGRLTVIMIGADNLLVLGELEGIRDLATFRETVRNDDGQRAGLIDLYAKLDA